jgi:hypothetical protein
LPGPFTARPNVKEASNHVLPHFYRDVQLKLFKAIQNNPLPPPETDYALIIGIDRLPEEVTESVQYAVQDAQAFSAFLNARGGSYLDETFKKFTGKVTAEEIFDELDKLGKRRDIRLRNVLIYYAGCGMVAGKEGILKHQLLTSSEAIDLEELVEKLSALDCASCILILDCGFSGKDGRCVPFEGNVPAYPDSVMESEKVAVFFACGPGESAYEDSDTGFGVFTNAMLEYLKQVPNTQEVNSKALVQRICFKVSRHARECGAERQEPTSNSTDAVLIPLK